MLPLRGVPERTRHRAAQLHGQTVSSSVTETFPEPRLVQPAGGGRPRGHGSHGLKRDTNKALYSLRRPHAAVSLSNDTSLFFCHQYETSVLVVFSDLTGEVKDLISTDTDGKLETSRMFLFSFNVGNQIIS